MRCSVCGEDIPADSLFCPNCGTRVAAPAGAPTLAASPTSGEAAPPRLAQPYEERAAPQWDAPSQPPAAPQWATPGTLAPLGGAVPNSTTAVISLVFGILSWFALPVIGSIVAVIAGHMARAEIRRSNGQLGGGGMATAGIILGYIQLALLVLGICAFVGIFALAALGGMSTAP
jgi:hypothetical protein